MSTYDVIVKAVDQTQATFKGIENGLKRIESLGSNVQRILGGLITAQAIKSFVTAGEELANIQRRLSLIMPAGTDVTALFNGLTSLSTRLGISTTELSDAYITLRNNGIQPTAENLTMIGNIAKATGGNMGAIADALGNIADADKLKKIEQATGDFIKLDEVTNKFGAATGQFAVKFGGQIVGIARSSQEALDIISKVSSVNLTQPAAQTDTLTDSWKRFKNAIGDAAKQLLEGGLQTGLTYLINSATLLVIKWTPLLKNLGPDLANALVIGARGVQILADSFEILKIAALTYLGVLTAQAFIGLATLIGQQALAARTAAAGLTAMAAAATAAAGGMGLMATAGAVLSRALPWLKALTIVGIVAGSVWSLFGKEGKTAADDTTDAMKKLNEETARQKKLIEDAMSANQKAITGGAGAPGLPATGGLQAPKNKPLAPNVLNALQQVQKQAYDAEIAIKVLEPALIKAFDTNKIDEYNLIFKALSSNYETLGRNILPAFDVAASNAFKDLNFSIAEDVQKLGVMEANLQKVTDVFGAGSPIVSQYKDQIDELRKKFDPLAPSIKTVEDRQLSYINSIKAENKELALTTESLTFLKQALDQGLLSYDRYIEKLSAVDTKLLDATQRQEVFNGAISKQLTDAAVQAQQAGTALTQAYASGDLERFVAVYNQYKSVLGATASGELQTALKAGREEVDLTQKKEMAFKSLVDQYKAGEVGTKVFEATAQALGANADKVALLKAQYQTTGEAAIELGKTIENSVAKAATTFADEFSKAFVSGKNMLSSFKNFFVNILNDIAAQIVKQQIASPLAAMFSSAIGSFLGLPGKATGGPVTAGNPYIVGEQGPELFIPGRTGSIVPNNTMGAEAAATGNGQGPLVVNFTIQAVDTQSGVQFLLQNKPVITSMISDAYNRRGRRGPLD